MKYKYIIIYIISIIFLISIEASAQKKTPTKKELEANREKTLKEIELNNKLLEQSKSNQKSSQISLTLISNKISVRKQLIGDIRTEITYLNEKIKETEFVIKMMEEDLDILKNSYAKMIRAAWQNKNSQNSIMFIISAKDFNQSYMRLRYMKELAKYREKQLKSINAIKEILNAQAEKLRQEKREKDKLLNQEKKEEQNLKEEQKQQEKILTKLKTEQGKLEKEIKLKTEQASKLKAEIEKLIAAEIKKSSSSSSSSTKYTMTPSEKIISTNFEKNRGGLPWPVEKGVIVSSYGKQPHPVLKNIEINNNGIDISTVEGSTVRAVFDGEVKKIFTIPGAQNAVIIRHGEYLSVYTHLETVGVKVGQNLKTKQIIGTVHTDVNENKTILHFEIWKDSSTQNPYIWLSK